MRRNCARAWCARAVVRARNVDYNNILFVQLVTHWLMGNIFINIHSIRLWSRTKVRFISTKNTATFLLALQENNRICFYLLNHLWNKYLDQTRQFSCQIRWWWLSESIRSNTIIKEEHLIKTQFSRYQTVVLLKRQMSTKEKQRKICQMWRANWALVLRYSRIFFINSFDMILLDSFRLPSWRLQRDNFLELDEAIWPVKYIEVYNSEPGSHNKAKLQK